MKIIICGAGQVGWQIARHLSGERNDVTVIDRDAGLVARATDALDVQGVTGYASYPDVLARAGAEDADMIVAATHSDEVNMVTCQVAHSVFAIQRKIARLRSKSYLEAIYADLYRQDHMPIDVVISPEKEVAEAALARLAVPSAFDTELFLEGTARLIAITVDSDCPVVDTPLRQLTDLFSTLRALVVGLRRGGTLFVPTAEDQIFAGDEAYLFVDVADVARTMEIFGKPHRPAARVVVLGGGNVGLSVASDLERRSKRVRVKVIERDRAAAEHAADALDRTVVLHGDGLDAALLREASVEDADAILAVTSDDKTNMLASVRAKDMGAGMAVCLTNDPSLTSLMTPLGIDAWINPRATTVSSILRHVRHGRVRAVYSVGDAEAEMIETQVLSTSVMAGRTLAEIDFPEGALVGGILRGGRFRRARADTRIEEGDVVAIFALAEDIPEVERLMQVSIDFF
ncbi:MAG: Trk system potassium transporter TrkA [Paracoccaceae bacterium]